MIPRWSNYSNSQVRVPSGVNSDISSSKDSQDNSCSPGNKRVSNICRWWLVCCLFQCCAVVLYFQKISDWTLEAQLKLDAHNQPSRQQQSGIHADFHIITMGRDGGSTERPDTEQNSTSSHHVSSGQSVPSHHLRLASVPSSEPQQDHQQSTPTSSPSSEDEFNLIIDTFRKVMKGRVYFQTQSWNLLAGSHQDTRTNVTNRSAYADDDRDHHHHHHHHLQIRDLLSQSPHLQQQRQTAWSNFESLQQQKQQRQQQRQQQQQQYSIPDAPSGDQNDLIIWDNEADVSSYFDHLINNCGTAFDATTDQHFQQRCWDSLLHLVDAPRCTTQLDSTFTCDGNATASIDINATGTVKPAQIPSLRRIDPQQLIRDHFLSADNSINIVIIGAGPVGLFLANILSRVKGFKRPLRVLVFEKRTTQPGRKKAYERDWLTELPSVSFEQTDPRIVEFLSVVHTESCDEYTARMMAKRKAAKLANSTIVFDEKELDVSQVSETYDCKTIVPKCIDSITHLHTTLPIKVHETFLLISNRELGVKFIYEDVASYKDMLASMPNMMVFDASGHRMDQLHRGDIEGARVTISKWTDETAHGRDDLLREPDFDRVGLRTYKMLSRMDMNTRVAQHESDQGTILYPVTKDTHEPFVVRMLKINDSRYTQGCQSLFIDLVTAMKDVMLAQTAFCSYCAKSIRPAQCDNVCRLSFGWDVIEKYRQDIGLSMTKRPPGFATMVSILTLTARQHDALMYLTKGGATAMPLGTWPLTAMMFDSVMRENNLIHALKLYWRYAGSMYPLASMLSHVPYIYADPLIPTTAITNARIGDAPLLRVGDSMWTGNPNWSNGLTMHVATLHKFSKLLNDIDTNDDDDGI